MKVSKKNPPKSPHQGIILKHTLKNALDFQGKANSKVVLGQVLKEDPSLRAKVPVVLRDIENQVNEIENLTLLQIKEQLQQLAPELLTEKKEEAIPGPLKPLPHAEKGKVVLRIAPSPSGPLHIGHAYGLSLNYEYAQMYQGKLLLRIEDTNAENIYPPAYEMIEQDARWLTDNHIHKIFIQSSRLGIYYEHAEKLVQLEKAYVCTCDAGQWRDLKKVGVACPCRSLAKKEQLQRYVKMFTSYAEGEAVLRLRTDIQHKNPAMRDFGIMRIVEHIHPQTNKEQRVWPLMVFAVAIDDHEMGVTHVLNGKDHADNALKEQLIMGYLGWVPPTYKHWGRINFTGMELSTTKTRIAIEEGKYKGWDDIRLPFLPALRKRGYQPRAFRQFALEVGLSLNDKTVTVEEFWKMIDAFNKNLIDDTANRYFFIENQVQIQIQGAPPRACTLELHPHHPERGQRVFQAEKNFYLSPSDLAQLPEKKIHRLMDCLNFKKVGKTFHYVSQPYEEYKNSSAQGKIIHWLPEKTVPVEVMLTDGTILRGIGEESLAQLHPGDIIQFERRYFVRVQEVTPKKITVWQLHR